MRIIKVTVRFQDACQRLNDKTETLVNILATRILNSTFNIFLWYYF